MDGRDVESTALNEGIPLVPSTLSRFQLYRHSQVRLRRPRVHASAREHHLVGQNPWLLIQGRNQNLQDRNTLVVQVVVQDAARVVELRPPCRSKHC